MGCTTSTMGRHNGCLSAKVSLLENGLTAAVNVIGEGLKANIGLVCTPNTDIYIRVKPTILWFSKSSETLDVEVSSNVKWIVK